MTAGPEALIVGGGPAGAALGLLLAREGRGAVILERQPGPHDKVCGEFVSGEAVAALRGMGVDLAALGAVPIGRVRLARRRTVVETPLPFPALSLSRRRLDAALLDTAEIAGAEVRRGFKVRALERGPHGWRAETDDGRFVLGPEAFLAVGKHDLKSYRRGRGLQNDLIAFKMHWRLAPEQTRELDGAVELGLFKGGYAGLEPIEEGKANLCLVVRRTRYRALDGWPRLLAALKQECALLDRRLDGAEAQWDKPLAIAAIPYGRLARAEPDGPWRLGDQAAVIPSFAGDGLAIALHSAALAARTWSRGGDARTYARELANDLRPQVTGATLLSHALVRGMGQTALMAVAGAEPRLMAATARLTRIPASTLRRAGAAA